MISSAQQSFKRSWIKWTNHFVLRKTEKAAWQLGKTDDHLLIWGNHNCKEGTTWILYRKLSLLITNNVFCRFTWSSMRKWVWWKWCCFSFCALHCIKLPPSQSQMTRSGFFFLSLFIKYTPGAGSMHIKQWQVILKVWPLYHNNAYFSNLC